MKKNIKSIDVDHALVESGLAPDIEHARSMISCGLIFIGDKLVLPGIAVNREELLEHGFRIKNHKQNVSRGGVKLSSVFDKFDLNVDACVCMDVGASTGGFTELLLKKGAKIVYAVDVGKNILDYKLRIDKRVVVLEGVNARFLDGDVRIKETIAHKSLDIIVMDLSFISIKMVIPKVLSYLKKDGFIIPLIKPQFEAELDEIEKGGVVRSQEVIDRIIKDAEVFLSGLGLRVMRLVPSKIKGPSGNQEYFFVCLNDR